MLLDRLKNSIDGGSVAVLGAKGAPDTSFIEKVGHRYCGEVGGEDIEEKSWDALLERLRPNKGHPLYDLGWASSWQTVSQQEALQWIKRPLVWYAAAAGMNENLLVREAKLDRGTLRHINEGRAIAPGVASRICDVLSKEFGRPIRPEDIRGLKIC